jgi:predicted AlkP superfamily phosphohydrolase/phosphomutase
MSEKVILILVDGMRPDSLYSCNNAFVKEFLSKCKSSMKVKTVMPSVTLPCHMSLFHSVTPQRHGILANTYVPQVRPISGLFEQIAAAGKMAASFYNWEELRDISRPGALTYSFFFSLYFF